MSDKDKQTEAGKSGSRDDNADRDASPDDFLRRAVNRGEFENIAFALRQGADINAPNPKTGLAAIHIAVGLNDFSLTRYLIEECNAALLPDRFGRMPTLIAAQCKVDDELSEYILEAEARFLEQERSE